VSDEEGQKDTPAHQAWGTMHLEFPLWARRFPTLTKSPLQAALQAARSQGENIAGFKFYPVLERPDPNNPGKQQRFHDQATDWCQWAQDLTTKWCRRGGRRFAEHGTTSGNRRAERE
jgi:sulfatase maturation enzyme AslB (radical SAM superfamily)